ncbi:MAG: hypothetical protein E7138_01430 [Rikenellaceae bacterium]|nr:hypothetical protein [Rikenellaceae bacterium]
MNIELIKQEIETLSALLSSWEQGQEVSAIERGLALEKLTKLYELVRFGAPATEVTPTPAAPAVEKEETTEQEVEVEFIFAEEDEESAEEEAAPTEVSTAEVSAAAAIAAVAAEVIAEPEPKVEVASEPAPAPQSAPVQEPEPAQEPVATPALEPEPVAELEKPAERPHRKPSMESLFGADEIQRKPRSKHQRMMAIYGEPQQKQEKVVDISKIFDMDDDEGFEISVSRNTRTAEPVASSTVNDASSGEKTILAEAITPKTTLADTIAAPAALAEEITHSHIKSLRQAIGINDKFLMTRDLFDGDDVAFDKAIEELDECESFDDCMIHIAENYEWNPDSEGAKFIMQLLERKHL